MDGFTQFKEGSHLTGGFIARRGLAGFGDHGFSHPKPGIGRARGERGLFSGGGDFQMGIITLPVFQAPLLPAPLAVIKAGGGIHRTATGVVLYHVTHHHVAGAAHSHPDRFIRTDAKLR